MTTTLDVLLLEAQPGSGGSTATALEQAGHRVHRCHDPAGDGFACQGMVEGGTCPLDGHVDAAVLARAGGGVEPTPFESGVHCALRAGVPLVAVGGEAPGPFEPWVTLRAADPAVSVACRAAIALAHQPLVDAVEEELRPVLRDEGVTGDVRCRVHSTWPRLRVTVEVDAELDRRLEQRLGVRAYDVVREHEGTHQVVDVAVAGLGPV